MLLVYLSAIFLSAALLFLVQPMAAKLVLPILGGSPSVWNTTMVFFQALLLLGYFYSHLVTKKLPRLAQGVVHAAVIAAGAFMLPIALPKAVGALGPGDSPALWLLMLLPLVAGVPFFVLTTTGPLLQSWFASSDHARAKDPYFLYAASNIGSFVGLLSFPFYLEPRFDLAEQSAWFSRGYYAFAALAALCFLFAWRGRGAESRTATVAQPTTAITWPTRLLWIALAAVPSSLSLGVTQTITTDIAPVPMLWVVPLSIYLLTFVLAFWESFPFRARTLGPLVLIATLAVVVARFAGTDMGEQVSVTVHLAMLATGALLCHRRLAEARPGSAGLTEFYLCLALGGVAGGAFNAFVAPLAFNAPIEYPIAIAATCCLIPSARPAERRTIVFSIFVALAVTVVATLGAYSLATRGYFPGTGLRMVCLLAAIAACVLLLFGPRGRAVRFGVAAMVAFVVALLLVRERKGTMLYVERTFFGIHEVYNVPPRTFLVHGTTTHGVQFNEGPLRATPVSYYHPEGPLGDLFEWKRSALSGESLRAGALGLGAGSIAAYARPQDRLTFFEIDPAIAAIATNPDLFTFVSESKGTIDIVIGDGRASLANDSRRFDLLILDAFSSDSIPMHLLTREAIRVYQQRLADHGAIAFHVSSRFLTLAPIMSVTVASTNAQAEPDPFVLLCREDNVTLAESRRTGRYPTTWLVALRRSDAASLLNRPGWYEVVRPAMRPWTDSYSSIWSAINPDVRHQAEPGNAQ